MSNVILLDGGMGQELVRRSGDRPTALWSTQVMIDRPSLVLDIHRDFFAAGATVATTNTYAMLRDRLDRVGLADEIGRLADTALRAAETARDENGHGMIAGAIGPLVASYRPDLCPPPDMAAALYAEPVRLLADRADLILFETMSSVAQAEGALLAMQPYDKPVWIALSVDDHDGRKLRSGEPIEMVSRLFERFEPAAVMINCSPPETIGAALDVVRDFGLPFGAYANGFVSIAEGFLTDAPTVDALTRREDLSPAAYAAFVADWVAQGATIVGGCCEVGPEHIAEVAATLRRAGHSVI
ncbi:MAG: homocysteine S-methyltransferase family protein [Pseudomonadota bacterium]